MTDAITKDAQRDQGVNVAHLMQYTEKNCDNPANAEVMVRVPAALLSPIGHGAP